MFIYIKESTYIKSKAFEAKTYCFIFIHTSKLLLCHIGLNYRHLFIIKLKRVPMH